MAASVGYVFCEIAAGEQPAEVIYDGPDALAFLDARPLFHGHTLLIPREHHETLADLPEDQVGELFLLARRLSVAVRDGMGAEGSFMAMNNKVSQSVPHLHVHVVPRVKGDGLRGFFWPRRSYETDEQLSEAGRRIRAELEPG